MPRQTQNERDAALIRRVMKVAGEVSQQIVAERLGKTQAAVSHCIRGRSELSKLERRELKAWLAELRAEEMVGAEEGVERHQVPQMPLAFFEHLKGCADCLVLAYAHRQ
jgi:predicted transcriptional regulator